MVVDAGINKLRLADTKNKKVNKKNISEAQMMHQMCHLDQKRICMNCFGLDSVRVMKYVYINHIIGPNDMMYCLGPFWLQVSGGGWQEAAASRKSS